MPDKFHIEVQAGQLPMKNLQKGIAIVVALFIIMAILVASAYETRFHRNSVGALRSIGTLPPTDTVPTSAPTAGVTTVHTNPHGIPNRDGPLALSTKPIGDIIVPDGFRIDWKMETANAFLLVQSKKDGPWHPQLPRGWEGTNHLVIEDDGNCYSFKLDPRPDLVKLGITVATTGSAVYVVHPATERPYWK